MSWIIAPIVGAQEAIKRILKLVTYDGEFLGPDGQSLTPVGVQGAAAGLPYVFSTDVAASDPGNGKFKLNNANATLATVLRIDNQTSNGTNVTPFLDSFVDGSNLIIKSNSNSDAAMLIYTIGTPVSDGTGYRNVPVTYVAGTSFADLQQCSIQYYVAGPAAIDGVDGVDGVDSYRYVAYADSSDGATGFTLTFDAAKIYRAEKHSEIEIANPVQADFTGLWYKALGTDGTNGMRAGLNYQWASSNGNANPGGGKIRLSITGTAGSAMTPGTACTFRINEADVNAVNLDGIIATLSGGDVIEVRSNTNAGITYMAFRVVTPPVDATGYWNIAVTVLAGSFPVTNGEAIAIQLIRQGSRAGINYQFDTSGTSGDPTSGLWRANTADMSAVTTLYIDDESLGATSMVSFISSWVKNGLILIQGKSNASNQFGVLKIVSVTDSGTYYTIVVTPIAGTTITDKTECVFTYIPGANVSWDPVTSTLADAAGNDIGLPLMYNLLSDAPAASGMVGKAAIVKALSAAIGALPQGICAKTASRWECLGKAVFAHDTPNHRITAPASTFVGTYTFASAASGAQTKITGAGVHGLLTASVVTGSAQAYIRIKDGSGTNWVPGLYKLTAVTDSGSDLTIDHPYSASFGQPLIGLEDAFFVAYRIPMPAFSSAGWVLGILTYKFSGTAAAKGINVEIVATGGLLGSGYSIWTPADDSTTNNVGGRASIGFNNVGAANVQHRQGVVTDLDGWNTTTGGDVGGTVGAVDTSAGFDILITTKVAAPNDINIVRNYLFEGAI